MEGMIFGNLALSNYEKGRRGPPQPLGSEARHFSVSAATPLPLTSDPHPSEVSVRVKLDSSSHPDQPFRTGELVEGHVHIYAPSADAISNASRLSLRVYFESRTLFWSFELVSPDSKLEQHLQSMKGFPAKDFENVMRHQVYRGIVPLSTMALSWSPSSPIDLDFQPGGPVACGQLEATLPFSFILPRKMSVTERNQIAKAPRDSCSLVRCPPPTFRDCRDGSVQWVAEAVLTLHPGSPPVQDEAMLRQSTDKEIVTRLIFPVMPTLEDVGVLRDEPYFGDHLMEKLYNSKMLSQAEQELNKKAALMRMRARGGSWEAYVIKMGYDSKKFVASEIYATAGARISVSALSIQLFAYLRVETTNNKSISSFFRSPKPQPIYVQRAVVSLYRITSTRGGKEVRPHIAESLLRQQEYHFESNATSASTPTGLLIPSGEDSEALELELAMDLQSQVEMGPPESKQQATMAKYLVPSFRTPNIQCEYVITVSFWLSGDKYEAKAARIPVQFVPGDESELPAFGDLVGTVDDQPPAFQADGA